LSQGARNREAQHYMYVHVPTYCTYILHLHTGPTYILHLHTAPTYCTYILHLHTAPTYCTYILDLRTYCTYILHLHTSPTYCTYILCIWYTNSSILKRIFVSRPTPWPCEVRQNVRITIFSVDWHLEIGSTFTWGYRCLVNQYFNNVVNDDNDSTHVYCARPTPNKNVHTACTNKRY
jgi:hypothetical protein